MSAEGARRRCAPEDPEGEPPLQRQRTEEPDSALTIATLGAAVNHFRQEMRVAEEKATNTVYVIQFNYRTLAFSNFEAAKETLIEIADISLAWQKKHHGIKSSMAGVPEWEELRDEFLDLKPNDTWGPGIVSRRHREDELHFTGVELSTRMPSSLKRWIKHFK